MNLKRILLFVGIVSLISLTYSTTTTIRGWGTSKVFTFPDQVLNTADDVAWTIQYVTANPNISAHFHATGDSALFTAIVQGTNFSPTDDKWVGVDTVTASGATVDAVYSFSNNSTSAVTYYAYRFLLSVGDTMTVSGAVKLTE